VLSTRLWLCAALLAAVPIALAAPRPELEGRSPAFVTRSGAQLELGGTSFRFGGANVEWLGLVGYGPADKRGPRYPTKYETDDALETAREMGVRVVRSQTMGDSVGCDVCIEPTRGRFNPAALDRVDYALASARERGIRIIPTIVGDDARGGGTGCVYLRWEGVAYPGCSLSDMQPFWTDRAAIADVEQHIRALLEHVNVYTGVAYKDDPTILGWDLLNGGGSPTAWTREIAAFVRHLDPKHLILSGPANAALDDVDACVSFVYPHWSLPLSAAAPGIAACKAAKKPFVAYEYGWDGTNYPTRRALRSFLATLRGDPEVSGDAFWALEAHRSGHGWMPIPADTNDPAKARNGESGQWWALYYTGIRTRVNTAADMAARAQIIRRHNYAMAGLMAPPHRIPPRPIVTLIVRRSDVRVYWQGAAGAKDYSVQRAPAAHGPWRTLCRRCVTDTANGWVDHRPRSTSSWYRVVPYNLAGKPGPSSRSARG
jgi:mannan endo-1,4-beta-mannosidase